MDYTNEEKETLKLCCLNINKTNLRNIDKIDLMFKFKNRLKELDKEVL